MIIKVIERKMSEKSRFDRLGRYILNAKNSESILFARTARYVIDEKADGVHRRARIGPSNESEFFPPRAEIQTRVTSICLDW